MRDEATVIRQTRENYKEASANIDEKLKVLAEREQTQSVIWQRQYQEALKSQLDTAIDTLSKKNYANIHQYLEGEYENGFIGTMYSLQKQGIPLAMPIDQRRVVKMVETTAGDIKLSTRLYGNTTKLKNAVRRELSIGLSSGESYQDVAARLSRTMDVDYNKTIRIARTEGGRVQNASRYEASVEAKKCGADIVKQWDSTLDNRTRTAHRELDGQVRELEDEFEAEGQKAKHPHGFGVPWMDINCRCVVLQRARWAVEGEGYEDYTKYSRFADFEREKWLDGSLDSTVQKHGGQIIDLSDAKNFADFRERYKVVSNNLIAQAAATAIGVEVMGEAVKQVEAIARPIENPPVRPRKRDFSTDEAYEKAKEAYRLERASYEARVDNWVAATLEKPRPYDTVEKIEDWAKTRGVHITDDVLNTIDKRFLNDVIEVTDELDAKFPQVRRMFADTNGEYRIYTLNGSFEYLEANQGLGISASHFGDFEAALRDYAYRTDIVYGDGTIKTSVRHEFGHNLDSAIKINRFYGGVENLNNPYFEVDHAALREYTSELKNMANKYGSEYSQTNELEAFAEGFAEYTSNPESKFGKAFGEFLVKWLM